MKDFKSQKTTIADILSKKDVRYRVPSYQRHYSWREEHLLNMWDDILNEEVYFLGTFVLNNEFFDEEKIKDIVDGQQRLLTITILFAVIRDQFLKLKDKQKSDGIQVSYISERDDDGNDSFKIIPGDSLREFFENGVQKDSIDIFDLRPNSQEEKRVINNYRIFQEKIENILKEKKGAKEKIEFLQDLREKVKKLSVVLIEVSTEEDAFTFFETLNARGLQLSTSDIIKNLLFKNIVQSSSLKREVLEQKWQQIIDNLTGEEEVDPTQFIRHYWLSKYKKITEKKLFSEIKKEFFGRDYTFLLEDLVKNSELYSQVVFPNQSDWDNRLLDIYKSIYRLKTLNVKQPYSLLLSLLRVIRNEKVFNKIKSAKEIYFVFEWIEHFTFVFTSVVGKSPSPLEGIYSRFAIEIEKHNRNNNSKKVLKTIKDLKKELSSRFPKENEFKDNFVEIVYKNSPKQISFIKYIFEKINYYNSNNEQRFDHVTIEHILPQNPDEQWGLTKEDIKDYVNKIGNLIVLGKEYNRKASNKIIKTKIEMYKKSGLNIVKELVQKLEALDYQWSKKDIEDRGQNLAEKAWSVWQLK